MIRRLVLAGRPPETRFFAFVGVFGLVLAAIYWFLSYELAGTVMLVGFGAGGLVIAAALVVGRDSRPPDPADAGPLDLSDVLRGSPADEVPFEDESGRQPAEGLAPLALGLGISMSLTAVVFGPWLIVAGVVPLVWGALTWLRSAGHELGALARAEDDEEALASRDTPAAGAADPAAGAADPGASVAGASAPGAEEA